MTSALIWAALLGLTLGAGLLLILVTQPVGWRPSLEQRVEPQLRHHIPASRLLEEERAGASPWGTWGRILDPVVQAGVGWVQRISPGGVALDRKLNQEDGMHPNAQGVAIMVDGILPHLTGLLDDLPRRDVKG